MSAFAGRRKGFRVSRHLERKSDAFIEAKMLRLDPSNATDVKVWNVCLGVLKSRRGLS